MMNYKKTFVAVSTFVESCCSLADRALLNTGEKLNNLNVTYFYQH